MVGYTFYMLGEGLDASVFSGVCDDGIWHGVRRIKVRYITI